MRRVEMLMEGCVSRTMYRKLLIGGANPYVRPISGQLNSVRRGYLVRSGGR